MRHFNIENLKNDTIYKSRIQAEKNDVSKLQSLVNDKECIYRDAKKNNR